MTINTQTENWAQYTAVAAQTLFSVTFAIDTANVNQGTFLGGLDVYYQLPNTTPSANDLITGWTLVSLGGNPPAYNVDISGAIPGGAVAGAIVTIVLNMNMENTVQFTGNAISTAQLNSQFDRITLMNQQLRTYMRRLGIFYIPNAVFDNSNIYPNASGNTIPVLPPATGDDSFFWSADTTGNIVLSSGGGGGGGGGTGEGDVTGFYSIDNRVSYLQGVPLNVSGIGATSFVGYNSGIHAIIGCDLAGDLSITGFSNPHIQVTLQSIQGVPVNILGGPFPTTSALIVASKEENQIGAYFPADDIRLNNVEASLAHMTVTGIQGTPVSSTAPIPNQGLVFNGTAWTPTSLSPVGLFAFFSAYNTGMITIPPETDTNIIFNFLQTNINFTYNNTTGTLTIITPGYYYFSASLVMGNAAEPDIVFTTVGAPFGSQQFETSNTSNFSNISIISQYNHFNAGDSINLTIRVVNSTGYLAQQSFWNAILIRAD